MLKRYKKNKRGFTLIELLVVVAIISLLSSVVLSSLQAARSKGRDAKRFSDMRQLQIAIEMYASDHNGDYPQCVGSVTTTACSSEGSYQPLTNLDVATYLKTIPSDPLNIKLQYGYYYARGWRPTGGNQIENTGKSNDYILGTRLENSSNAKYNGWSNPNLNYRVGE